VLGKDNGHFESADDDLRAGRHRENDGECHEQRGCTDHAAREKSVNEHGL
jgi:hypothetical protein